MQSIKATLIVVYAYKCLFQRTCLCCIIQGGLLVWLLLGTVQSFSFQNLPKTDSLRTLLLAATDTQRVNLLNSLGKQYWTSQADTAQWYAQEALNQARKIHYRKGEAEALRIMGWSSIGQGNLAQARFYVGQAVRLFEQIGYEPGLAAALNNLGVIEQYSGNYPAGLQAHNRALPIFRKLGNLEAVGSVLNYIGINYQAQGNYEKAIEYCWQGLQIRQKIQDHPGIAFSLINMGNMYLAADKLQPALEYYQQSLAYAQAKALPSLGYSLHQLGVTHGRLGQYQKALHYLKQLLAKNANNVGALNAVGEVYLAMEQYDAALKNLMKSLALLEKHQTESLDYAKTLTTISKVYSAQKQYQKALPYAQRSFSFSRQKGARKETKAAAQTLSEIYAGMRDFARAFEYQHLYLALKDSITSEDYTRRLAVLEANLELAKKQAHIEALTKEQQLQQQKLKQQATLRNISIAGLGFTVVLGLMIFRNITLKRRTDRLQKEQLESELALERLKKDQEKVSFQNRTAELEMMALRAQMNPHFIFNCLNSINRFILKNEPEAASDYLTKFSKLIRLILQNSQSKTVFLENELEALRLYVEMEVLRFEGQFTYQIICDPDLEVEELEVPPLIIQPYVENAIWHGLMHKEGPGSLKLELHRENYILYCSITDNGVGRKRATELKSKSASKNKSLGMQITAHRLELINAINEKPTTVEVTDLVDAAGEPCGTRVLLKIPV